MPAPRPLVIAHRGASHAAVDNSVEAFELAIVEGADLIEFDIRRLGDDRLVAFHDPTAGGRSLRDLTHAELTELVGHRPPLLEEILSLARGRIGVDVELKEEDHVDRVLSAVRAQLPAAEVMVTSFLPSAVAQVRRRWPEVRAGLLLAAGQASGPDQALEHARACDATAVALEDRLVDRDGIGWAHAAGLGVLVWTVNDETALSRHLGDDRVDGVITDVPGRAIAVRGKRPSWS